MATFYALRYVAGTPFEERKHAPCVGRFETAEAAEAARQTRTNAHLLEVVVREAAS